jgi:hypothetical protein
MSDEERQNLFFDVAYSFCYEKMMYKFWGRLDKLCSMLLLLLSASVMASFASAAFLGLAVAAVSVLQFVYAPGVKAVQSKQAFVSYSRLYAELSDLDTAQIKARMLEIADSDAIGLLAHPACLAACAMLNRMPPTCPPQREMTLCERVAAHFAGEFPEYRGG